jgi:hypothetical protein
MMPWMLTGSIASSLYGEPRLTHAIDVIVQVTAEDALKLAISFPKPRYYLDEAQSIMDMVREAPMFNLIDTDSGDKVDFWIPSPEDVILSKLSWLVLAGGSEKQFRDALRVFEVQHAKLDLAYCEAWALRLGAADLWPRLLTEAASLN